MSMSAAGPYQHDRAEKIRIASGLPRRPGQTDEPLPDDADDLRGAGDQDYRRNGHDHHDGGAMPVTARNPNEAGEKDDQSVESADVEGLLTEIDHIAIAVNDLGAAIDYYRETFGAVVDHRDPIGAHGGGQVA